MKTLIVLISLLIVLDVQAIRPKKFMRQPVLVKGNKIFLMFFYYHFIFISKGNDLNLNQLA